MRMPSIPRPAAATAPRAARRRKTVAVASGLTAAALLAALSLTDGPADARTATPALVRVAGTGYADQGAKEAFLLAKSPVTGATWRLVGSGGRVAATGRTGRSLGSWNSAYKAVYLIDFSGVRRDGRYRLAVDGSATGRSGTFVIGSRQAVLGGPRPTPPPSSRPSATAPTPLPASCTANPRTSTTPARPSTPGRSSPTPTTATPSRPPRRGSADRWTSPAAGSTRATT